MTTNPIAIEGDLGESPEDHGPPRVLDLYDATGLLGSVCIARSIRAVRPDGVEIGTYPTVEEARRAVVMDADRREVSS